MSVTLTREETKPPNSAFPALARKLATLLEEVAYTLYEYAESVDPTPPKYERVQWMAHLNGEEDYNLTPIQMQAVAFLQRAWKRRGSNGKINPLVSGDEVLCAVGVDRAAVVNLRDLFRGSKAWGRLVKQEKKSGLYYLDPVASSDLERCEKPSTLRRQCPWELDNGQ